MTVEQALDHPWMRIHNANNTDMVMSDDDEEDRQDQPSVEVVFQSSRDCGRVRKRDRLKALFSL
jgi:hypothetical protein